MLEMLGIVLASMAGTALGAIVAHEILQKGSRGSEKTDDRLNGERARLWRVMYMKRRLHKSGRLDQLDLIKFDALVTVFRRGEITYQKFNDELDKLENEDPPNPPISG